MARDRDRQQPMKGLGALQGLRKDLPPKQGATPPPAAQAQKPPAQNKPANAGEPLLESARIPNPRRASRAPYNFVPQAKQIRWIQEKDAPQVSQQGMLNEGLHSGEIELRLTAITDFFTPGMTAYDAFLGGKETKDQTLPYMVNGKLALPGPALRGMTRALVEILADCPLDPINDRQLFFRTVAANKNPQEPNFEPHAIAYKTRMSDDQVKAGYLTGGLDEWKIRPAQTDENGRQFYRVRMDEVESLFRRRPEWISCLIYFQPRKGVYASISTSPREGFRQGWLVCSGPMQGKRSQWVLLPPDETVEKDHLITVSAEDVKAYKEDGATRDLKKNEGFDFTKPAREKHGHPCFFTQWEGHTGFGHTRHFRLAYVHTTGSGVPEHLRRQPDEQRWDLAQLIFGRAPKSVKKEKTETAIQGARGRVFFEDALWQSGPDPAYRDEVLTTLGQPKPTSFELYLNQPGPSTADSLQWDGNHKGDRKGRNQPVARGFKRYWIRRGAAIPPPPRDRHDRVNMDTVTRMRPACAGAVFLARVRFQGLTGIELGALLTALDLDRDLAHQLGRGKPHGLGVFRIEVTGVRTIDLKKRYLRFVGDDGVLEQGWNAPHQTGEFKKQFAQWLGTTPEQLWSTPRMQALRALMTNREPTNREPADRWLQLTRYMVIQPVNEYQYVPDPNHPSGRRREMRRPLPPAVQVASQGTDLPDAPPPQKPAAPPGGARRR